MNQFSLSLIERLYIRSNWHARSALVLPQKLKTTTVELFMNLLSCYLGVVYLNAFPFEAIVLFMINNIWIYSQRLFNVFLFQGKSPFINRDGRSCQIIAVNTLSRML